MPGVRSNLLTDEVVLLESPASAASSGLSTPHRFLLAALLLVAGGVGIAAWFHELRRESIAVDTIVIGDDDAKVLAVVGRPTQINSPPDHMWCNRPGVAHEYMYGTALFASWDVLGFDKDGRVVCKRNLQSP